MTIQVLIADDHPLMRAAMRMTLTAEPDLEVVGEAADGLTAGQLARQQRPPVAIMDIRLPILDGVAATECLTDPEQGRPVKVLVITSFHLDEYVVEALRAGASGFLLKDVTSEELIRAVRVVAADNALLAPSVTKRLLDRYARRLPPATPQGLELLGNPTERELAVLKLVARGHSNAEIGRALQLAETTVKTHVGHLLAKLGVTDRVQLVVLAYESGLVQPGAI